MPPLPLTPPLQDTHKGKLFQKCDGRNKEKNGSKEQTLIQIEQMAGFLYERHSAFIILEDFVSFCFPLRWRLNYHM